MAVNSNKKKSAALGILMLLCIPLLAVGGNAAQAATNQEQEFSLSTFCSDKCRSCLLGAAVSCFSVLNILWNKSEFCACFVHKVIAEPCFFKK